MLNTILQWLTDATLADSILGDLEEVRRDRASRSRGWALGWFLGNAVGIILVISLRTRDRMDSGLWRPLAGPAPRKCGRRCER